MAPSQSPRRADRARGSSSQEVLSVERLEEPSPPADHSEPTPTPVTHPPPDSTSSGPKLPKYLRRSAIRIAPEEPSPAGPRVGPAVELPTRGTGGFKRGLVQFGGALLAVALLIGGTVLFLGLKGRPESHPVLADPAVAVGVQVPGGPFPFRVLRALPVLKLTRTAPFVAGFRIDRFEVTRAQYARCVQAGRCEPPRRRSGLARRWAVTSATARLPVVDVTWRQAAGYCKFAGGRLPTEVEWEKAARGKYGLPYPWGTVPPNCRTANYWGKPGGGPCYPGPVAVDAKSADLSPYGVVGLAGNVREWTADCTDGPCGPGAGKAPRSAKAGAVPPDTRPVRGGSFRQRAPLLLAHHSQRRRIESFADDLGFRCVR